MDAIRNRQEFAASLRTAISETINRQHEYPAMLVYSIILKQLNMIEDIIMYIDREPTFDEREQITMGNIALKSFKKEDPAYADRLMELGYKFYYYDELP